MRDESASNPERFRRLREIVESALEVPPGERGALLDSLCAGDAALRREALDVLSRDDGLGEFLEPPIRDGAREVAAIEAASAAVGERLGAYRVDEVIAAGGMGVVLRATRDDDAFEREVAVKIVRRDLGTRSALEAFQRERRLLARLDHPGIARLLDGGAARDGSPYFVMELVRGSPIDLYCDERGLGLRARLELLGAVCRAVQHAHGRLVVHGDLKPGNVLVTEEGVPKLVDFGVAAIFGGGEASAFSPRYSSPEQQGGQPLTTAADVHALGVLLSELGGRERAPRDVRAIVARATDPDPLRRISTAAELEDEIDRFLAFIPVASRRAGASERLFRFARRNRLAVGLVAAAFAVVSTFAWVSAGLARRLERERRAAVAAGENAERVASFLGDTLSVASPSRLGAGATVLDALEDASRRVATDLKSAPQVAAEVHATIARTFSNAGIEARAEPHLREALRLRIAAHGERSVEAADAMASLAANLAWLFREESIALAERALAIHRSLLGDAHRSVAEDLHGLAFALYRGGRPPRFAEAEARLAGAIDHYRRVLGPGSAEEARCLHVLAAMRFRDGRPLESEEVYAQALDVYERLGPAALTAAIDCRLDRAIVLSSLARHDEADAAVVSSAGPLERAGLRASAVFLAIGRARIALARAAEAVPFLEAAVRVRRGILAPGDPRIAESEGRLGEALVCAGRGAEGLPLMESAAAGLAAALGPRHEDAVRARDRLLRARRY